MSWNFLSNKNEVGGYAYTPDKPAKNKVILMVLVVILLLAVTVFAVILSRPDKFTQSALEAARKETPNAKVRDVRASGGFARAIVSDPKAESQIRSGNVTYFRVNEDETMTQIASGSAFSPIDLLGIGIPLPTQADITGISVDKVIQNLSDACGYSGSSDPGYVGFGGSFDPDGWQIDSGTLDDIEQVLNTSLNNQGTGTESNSKVVCVIATNNNSNAETDKVTYNSTFSLELNFVTGDGTVSKHAFTFSIGPRNFKSYTLDGRKLTDVSN